MNKCLAKKLSSFLWLYLLLLFNMPFVGAEGMLLKKEMSLIQPVFIFPFAMGLIAFFLTSIFLKDRLENKPLLKGLITGFITSIIYYVSLFFSSLFSGMTMPILGWILFFPIYVVGITVIISVIFIVVDHFRKMLAENNSRNLTMKTSFTKTGLLIGTAIAVIILFFGFRYAIMSEWNFGKYSSYTFIFAALSIFASILVGYVAQKIRERSNWRRWGYTKKGFVIGMISCLFVIIFGLIYVVFNIVLWALQYNLDKAIGIASRSIFQYLSYLLFFAVFFAILFTIIGWIIEKIKS